MLIFFLGASLYITQRQASVMGGVETEVFPSLPESGIMSSSKLVLVIFLFWGKTPKAVYLVKSIASLDPNSES